MGTLPLSQIKPEFYTATKDAVERLKENILSIITIQPNQLEYILAAKIAGGHVILADSHGVGKTSLARALAASINWKKIGSNSDKIRLKSFNRIQCTVDLLHQDILGFNRFDMKSGNYIFHEGPIFAHFILCDEINLLTPKTQGSFFQAMEEEKVSIEGETYSLSSPFFIIATMNLQGQHLFPLPAPQLDRFMIQVSMGFPSQQAEEEILQKHGLINSWDSFQPVIQSGELLAWKQLVDTITIDPKVISYIVGLIRKSRSYPGVVYGLSPRAGIKMSRIARALALVRGMNYATIDLVKELSIPVFSHRLELEDSSGNPSEVVSNLIKSTKVGKNS